MTPGGGGGGDPAEIETKLLLDAMYMKYCYDFRHYAPASLRRRLKVALSRMGCASVSQLQERILRDPRAFAALLRYLTVHVSDMFRDPGFFLALRDKVLPVLATYPSFKIWIAGCSTGEEAYSVAILLAEASLLGRALIYATDIDPEALREAERGVYAVERVGGFSSNYLKAGGRGSLSDHYTAAYDGVAFNRELRRGIVFSDHSLATDGVFAEVQLALCRNVLIYFNPELRDRSLALFRDSLVRRGFLGLGLKESVRFSAHAADFVEVDAPHRIYQRR